MVALAYLHAETNTYRNILWSRSLLRKTSGEMANVKFYTLATMISAFNCSHVALSQHLPNFSSTFCDAGRSIDWWCGMFRSAVRCQWHWRRGERNSGLRRTETTVVCPSVHFQLSTPSPQRHRCQNCRVPSLLRRYATAVAYRIPVI